VKPGHALYIVFNSEKMQNGFSDAVAKIEEARICRE
jgi:hypothetical protein